MSDSPRPRILVVEDDDMQQRLLQMLLGLKGYEVVSAMTGEEGKDRLATEEFSLILLDLVMPELDGVSFLRWLREEKGIETPVMIISSKDEDIFEAMGDLSNTTFQRKPVDLDQLTEDVEQLLTGS